MARLDQPTIHVQPHRVKNALERLEIDPQALQSEYRVLSATGVLIEPFSWLLEIDYSSAPPFSS